MVADGLWIIGGGGLAKGVADALSSISRPIAGLVIPSGTTASWYDGTVLDEASFLGLDQPLDAVVAIGDNAVRLAIVERYEASRPDIRWATVRHASAELSPTAKLGEGTIVLANAFVGPGATIGRHAVVYSGCLIEHDCIIGDFVSFGPGAVLGGNVAVGSASFVGLGARVAHGRRIGSDAVVGLGSCVVSDIPGEVIAYGVPCRVVSRRLRGDRYL